MTTQADLLHVPAAEPRRPECAPTIKPVTFRVHGLPVSQPRTAARSFFNPRVGKHMAHIYTPKGADLWKAQVAHAFREASPQQETIAGPVILFLRFLLPRPKGHFGSGRNAGVLKSGAPMEHISKPDLDNLEKAVKDALKGLAWRDDSQVFAVVKMKDFGQPGVWVRVAGAESRGEILKFLL